ncbi:uncharacterized protein RCC_05329 [Ramularia collo-cygni]|uniref:BTB domain-containing protein n=1 Tax=Ramularia collo-cygni TaxID=112498 RepID=A0A2D3UVZ1_9PEZI|nr:uncharacterized protein RCC_05329 [Ramularia collo-cygni]CZT19478.1 uncharacterized protein RCC_05329 [Ramularia collo-cygni]
MPNLKNASISEPFPIPPAILRPKKKAINFADDQVVVRVGTPSTTYRVNKQLLCDSSEYFRAALGPKWTEGKTGLVDMPEDDADAFNVYLNWVHKSKVFLDFDRMDDNGDDEHAMWELGILIYALGDKLLDLDFKDAISDVAAIMLSTVDGLTWMPRGHEHLLYEKLARDSKLNLLLTHKYARLSNIGDVMDESWPAGLLFNISQELLRVAKEKPVESSDNAAARCVFHEHAPGAENCYRAKRGYAG